MNAPPQPMLGAHARALGLRFVSAGDDWAEYALDYRDALAAAPDDRVIATSAIITMMDNACGMALRMITKGDARTFATLDLRIDYHRAVRQEQGVVGRARCERLTEQAAFLRGSAHDGDPKDPVASFVANFMRTDAP